MLVALSASHEHLDLGVLDALTRNADELPDRLAAAGPALQGAVVISTCNRLEIYMDAERDDDAIDAALDAISGASGVSRRAVAESVATAQGSAAATHLYEVAAGLRSMVMGESEISGQVRTAFNAALAAGHTTPLLNDLFQVGLRHAKKVSTTTGLGAAGRSGGAVALDRASAALDMPLTEAEVLIIGTGAYARVITAELRRRGSQRVHVHSGSGRAADYARTHEVTAVPDGGFDQAVATADLIVAASGQGGGVLRPEQLTARHGRRLVVLDLALHSDLDARLREREDVHVIGLRDLAEEIDDTGQIALAREILAEGVRSFTERQRMRSVDPAITYLRGTVSGTVEEEISRIRAKYDPQIAADFEHHLRRIAVKILHPPTVRARELARTGEGDRYVTAFQTLFGVDVASTRPRHTPRESKGAPRTTQEKRS